VRADEREKRESDTGRPSRTLGRRPGAWPADPLPPAVGGRYGYLVDKSFHRGSPVLLSDAYRDIGFLRLCLDLTML